MALPVPFPFSIVEDSGASLMLRVVGLAGTPVKQADLEAIDYKLFDGSGETPDTPTATGPLTIASVIFDTLQTDARWTADAIGYNFRWDMPASLFAVGGHVYDLELKFTPAVGQVFHLVGRGTVLPLRGS